MEHYLQQEGYDFVGAAFEVYNELGSGFLKEVYQQCLEHEILLRKIPFESKKELSIIYKGVTIEKKYIPDLVVHGEIVAELKAVKNICKEHEA